MSEELFFIFLTAVVLLTIFGGHIMDQNHFDNLDK